MNFKFFERKSICLLLLVVGLQPMDVAGGLGNLDTSFAGTGKARFGFGFGEDFCFAVATQADGKIVAAGQSGLSSFEGNITLVRYNTNNTVDVSFGNLGKVVTPIGTNSSAARAVRVQLDGKIVAAGESHNGANNDFVVVRYNADGSLDTSFAGTGIVVTDFGVHDFARAMVIQSDGKIVVGGQAATSVGSSGSFALARYNTNGTLDTTFGGTGRVTTSIPSNARIEALLIQSDGKIVAAGSTPVKLARYLTNGTLDTTFGTNGTGIVQGFFQNVTSSIFGLATQFGDNTPQNPDRLVAAGHISRSGGWNLAVLRLHLNGTLDTSFNGTGYVTNTVGTDSRFARAVTVQGFGIQPRKITVGGYGQSGTNRYFLLARYNSNGSFDTTLNGTGVVTNFIGARHEDEASAMTFQAGKVVLAGSSGVNNDDTDFALARYNSDGSLDGDFGSNGTVTTDIADRNSEARGVTLQSDSKLLVAGTANNSEINLFALARMNPNGSLDPTFGLGGKVTTQIGTAHASGNAIVLQADGKAIVAGEAFNGTDTDFAIARFNSDGSLDTNFNGTGKVLTPIGTAGDEAYALALYPDGKIVAAGFSNNGTKNNFAVARYLSNGALDTSFAGTGKAITGISSGNDTAQAVQIQSDGKIVAAGYSINAAFTSAEFSLVRYNTNGTLDTSFGTIGRVTTDFGIGIAYALAMVIQPDGRILLGGAVLVGGANSYIALARYQTNGAPDTSFGSSGKVTTQIGFSADLVSSMALQTDGKIVAGGVSHVSDRYEFAVMRFLTNGSLDTSYGMGGSRVIEFNAGGSGDTAWAVALDSRGRAVLAGDVNQHFGVARFLGDPFLEISQTAPNAVLVSWPSAYSDFTLQQNTNLNIANWFAPPESVNDDGTNKSIIVAPPTGQRSYRLFKP